MSYLVNFIQSYINYACQADFEEPGLYDEPETDANVEPVDLTRGVGVVINRHGFPGTIETNNSIK